jgi:hypothetical protein
MVEVLDGSVELDTLTAAAMASAFAGGIIRKIGPKSTFSFPSVFMWSTSWRRYLRLV